MNFTKNTLVNRFLLDMGMTQTEFAKIVGIERAHVNRIINGRQIGRAFPAKYKISKFFKVPINELFPEDAA